MERPERDYKSKRRGIEGHNLNDNWAVASRKLLRSLANWQATTLIYSLSLPDPEINSFLVVSVTGVLMQVWIVELVECMLLKCLLFCESFAEFWRIPTTPLKAEKSTPLQVRTFHPNFKATKSLRKTIELPSSSRTFFLVICDGECEWIEWQIAR